MSFGWNVPPSLRSRLGERDSGNVGRMRDHHGYETGMSPSMSPCAKGLPSGHPLAPHRHTTMHHPIGHAFRSELLPFRSPLLRESSSVSTPPLTNMLKVSGWSSPRSGQKSNRSKPVGHRKPPMVAHWHTTSAHAPGIPCPTKHARHHTKGAGTDDVPGVYHGRLKRERL